MAKSSFSFHCMICFEEFDPEERYPVVLPCGHTYVCCVCSVRLDKCMECRTPLYWNMPKADTNSSGSNVVAINHANNARSRSSWSSSARARSGTGIRGIPGTNTPPAPPVKKRLPLPKNVVLLSLIEATELATEDANKSGVGSPTAGSDDYSCANASMTSQPLTDEEEEEKIKIGTSVAVGAAGTYAVAAREGLPIFTSRPQSAVDSKKSEEQDSPEKAEEHGEEDKDLDALVRFFHLDNKMDVDTTGEGVKENKHKEPALAHLSCGDRVQVVSLEGGWAKLARGYGYVRAGGNQLVKVGGSLDRACKLEAMIRTISIQRKQLRMEQSKVDNLFIRLMNDLQISLMNDEDLTVIVADAFMPMKSDRPSSFEKEGRQESSASAERIMSPQQRSTDRSSIYPEKPKALGNSSQASQAQLEASGFVCFANDVFGTISGSSDMGASSVPCPSTPPIGQSLGRHVDDLVRNAPDVTTTLFPSRSHPASPSAMRAGARAWRELHGRAIDSGKIDFRTGLSGHMALLSTHAHPHEYLLDDTSSLRLSAPGSFRGMSNHTGLTMSKPKALFGVLPALPVMPLMGTPPRRAPTSPGPSSTRTSWTGGSSD